MYIYICIYCLARGEEDEATAEESCEEELVSPDGDVIEAMMQAPDLSVASSWELAPINSGSSGLEDTSVGMLNPLRLLSISSQQQQQQQPPPALLPLSTFEREAIMTRGRPWSSHPAKRFSGDAWYPIWRVYQRMGEKECQVVRRLEF